MNSELSVVARNLDRGVGEAIASEWRSAERELESFLEKAGVTGETVAWSTEILAVPFDSQSHAVSELSRRTRDEGAWSYLWASVDGGPNGLLLAMPVNDGSHPRPELIPFVEFHSMAVAWWLASLWRIQQLATASARLADEQLVIASSATVRSLVETVAAFDYDGRRIHEVWSKMKQAGPSHDGAAALSLHLEMKGLFREFFYGSKFTEAAPEAKEAWSDRVKRRNVMTQVAKYARLVSDADLATDYEWLCNVVHPSLGTTFVFSSDPFIHQTRTHVDRLWSRKPSATKGGRSDSTDAGHVEEIVARRATIALSNAVDFGRAMLRVIDDLALTTDAPSLHRRPQFRGLRTARRNDPCPCGSGLKAKRCEHVWGGMVPGLPEGY